MNLYAFKICSEKIKLITSYEINSNICCFFPTVEFETPCQEESLFLAKNNKHVHMFLKLAKVNININISFTFPPLSSLNIPPKCFSLGALTILPVLY